MECNYAMQPMRGKKITPLTRNRFLFYDISYIRSYETFENLVGYFGANKIIKHDSIRLLALSDHDVYLSNDGGENWQPPVVVDSFPDNYSEKCFDIHFCNDQIGIITRKRGNVIFKTVDGGLTWNKFTISLELNRIFMINDSVWYGWQTPPDLPETQPSEGVLYYTSDNGTTFQTFANPNKIEDLFFINDTLGWCSTKSGKVYKTTNRLSWSEQNLTNGTALHGLCFLNKDTGWVVGDSGKIFITKNSGSSWQRVKTHTKDNLLNIYMIDVNYGFCQAENGGEYTIHEFRKQPFEYNQSWIPWSLNISICDDSTANISWTTSDNDINVIVFVAELENELIGYNFWNDMGNTNLGLQDGMNFSTNKDMESDSLFCDSNLGDSVYFRVAYIGSGNSCEIKGLKPDKVYDLYIVPYHIRYCNTSDSTFFFERQRSYIKGDFTRNAFFPTRMSRFVSSVLDYGPQPLSFGFGDFNNDDVYDLLTNGGINLQNTFSSDYSYFTDFNNDNNIDVFTIEGFERNSFLHENENGILKPNIYSFENITYGSWGDIDSDGDLDFVTLNSSDGFIDIYKNNGDNNYVKEPVIFPFYIDLNITNGLDKAAINIYDFDNDGKNEILIGNHNMKIFEYVDSLTISDITFPETFSMQRPIVVDFDADGWLDILPNSYKIIHNDKNGTSFSTNEFEQLVNPSFVGDFDNDGHYDIKYIDKVHFYKNNQLRYETRKVYGINMETIGDLCADYDNDGDLDFFSETRYESNEIPREDGMFVYANQVSSCTKNSPPDTISGIFTSIINDVVVFSWNRAVDDFTPSLGLSYNMRVGSTPNGSEIMSPMANPTTGFRKVPRIGNASVNTFWYLQNFAPGTYYWSVQAIDNSYLGSMFAPEQTFTISKVNAGKNQLLCDINTTQLKARKPVSGYAVWSVISGSGTFAEPTQHNTQVTNLGVGNNVFRFSWSENSYSGFDDVTITYISVPQLYIISNSPLCKKNELILSANIIPNAIYSWNSPDYISFEGISSISRPNAQYNMAGNYLLWINYKGCVSLPTTHLVFVNNCSTVIPLISAFYTNPTSATKIPISVNFNQIITGFTQSDLVLENATLNEFQELINGLFTFNVYPITEGAVTISVPANVCSNIDGDVSNSAAFFSIVFENKNHSPTSIKVSNNEILENGVFNAFIGNLSSIDSDPYDTHTYMFASGLGDNSNSLFKIYNSQLLAYNSFDYEQQNIHSIRIRSTDQGGLWCEFVITINILDIFDTPNLSILKYGNKLTTGLLIDLGKAVPSSFSNVTIQIKNTGLNILSVNLIQIVGNEFSQAKPMTNTRLTSGQNEDLIFRFRPAIIGVYSGNIFIFTNDFDNPIFTINLTAECVDISLKPVLVVTNLNDATISANSTFNFGEFGLNGYSQVTFKVANIGATKLYMTSFNILGSNMFGCVLPPTTILAQNQSTNFSLFYKPTSPIPNFQTATFNLEGNQIDTYDLKLTGTCKQSLCILNEIPDIRTSVHGNPIDFTIPVNWLYNPENKKIDYKVVNFNGMPLPIWCTFIPEERRLFGYPPVEIKRWDFRFMASNGSKEVFDMVTIYNDAKQYLTASDLIITQKTVLIPDNILSQYGINQDPANVTYYATLANGEQLKPCIVFNQYIRGFEIVSNSCGTRGTQSFDLMLIVTDIYGASVTLYLTITISNGVFVSVEDTSYSKIEIYPNPTTGILHISGYKGEVEILDMQGRVLLNQNTQRMDISKLKQGIYFVRLQNENTNKTFKILKQ